MQLGDCTLGAGTQRVHHREQSRDDAVAGDGHRGAAGGFPLDAGRLQFRRQRDPRLGEQTCRTHKHLVAIHVAPRAQSRQAAEVLGRGRLADLLASEGGDGSGDCVLGGVLHRTRVAQHGFPARISGQPHLDDGDLPRGQCAGFVQHHGVDRPRRFQRLVPLDEHPELGPATRRRHERRRCGQPEGAGTRDDQDRQPGAKRILDGAAQHEPGAEGCQGQREDDRHEDTRDTVGEALHRGFVVLRLLHQPHKLRQLSAAADLDGPHDQAPAQRHRAAENPAANPNLGRDRLAGHGAAVHGAVALFDFPVGGDRLSGADDEPVADPELTDRDPAFLPSIVEQGHVLRAQGRQRMQGPAGAPLGLRLEQPAGQHEDRDADGDIEVDGSARPKDQTPHSVGLLARAPVAEHRVGRPAGRRDNAQRDQGVHGTGALPAGGERLAMKRPGAPRHDRQGQRQDHPLPIRKPQGWHQCQGEREIGDRNAEQQSDRESVPQEANPVGLRLGVRGHARRRLGRVSRLHYRCDQTIDVERFGAVHHRLLAGEVDARAHAVELVELAFHPCRAGGAGHPAHHQLNRVRPGL